jgi:hypothetical protein
METSYSKKERQEMNIAILTTWNSSCGIAEYSKNLVEEFISMGHNILILNNTTEGQNKNFVTSKIFGVSWWGENPAFDYNKVLDMIAYFETAKGKLDVLYIQYQSSLYEPKGFNEFLAGIKCPIVVTLHDSSLNTKHKFPGHTLSISHNTNIDAEKYIPFPTIEMQPRVFSFGMGGRNDFNFIREACKGIGAAFDCHDARTDGWLSEEDLFTRMTDADAIVLWYNEVAPLKGQSSALRTAISSLRPVIVNDVSWFSDAPGFVHRVQNGNVKEFTANLALQQTLWNLFNLDYIKQNSFANCAEKYLEVLDER